MVSTLDIYATAAAAAGGKAPERLDGVNLLPYLKGEKQGTPHEVLYWSNDRGRAVRKEKWRLMYRGKSRKPELYDLEADPGETRDQSEAQPEIARELESLLGSWEKTVIPRQKVKQARGSKCHRARAGPRPRIGRRSNVARYWHPAIVHDEQLVETGEEDFGPDLFVNFINDFTQRHKDHPFFVYFPMCLPHTSWDFQRRHPSYLGDRAGATVPENNPLDGVSFAPLLRGAPFLKERDWIFSYYKTQRFLRDRRFLLDGAGQFWDCGERRDEKGYVNVDDPAILPCRRPEPDSRLFWRSFRLQAHVHRSTDTFLVAGSADDGRWGGTQVDSVHSLNL